MCIVIGPRPDGLTHRSVGRTDASTECRRIEAPFLNASKRWPWIQTPSRATMGIGYVFETQRLFKSFKIYLFITKLQKLIFKRCHGDSFTPSLSISLPVFKFFKVSLQQLAMAAVSFFSVAVCFGYVDEI